MPTIFTEIVAGKTPCHRVWEDEEFLAFLDVRPVTAGHTLVIPKREIAYLFDLEPGEYGRLMEAARRVAVGLKRATGCARVCVMVIGWEVPHVHVHLVPTMAAGEVGMPAPKGDPVDLAAMAARIAAALR